MTAKQLKKKLLERKSPIPLPDWGLSTGSTLLNLAFTGNPNYGFSPGCYYLLVGKSSSGKTFLALTALAEASINPKFDKHRLIYDAPERGARMDLTKFFGQKMADSLEYRFSNTVEEFYYELDDAVKDGRPFIYVEDSESSLSSEDEQDKFQENKKAFRKGKQATGSYGDGKAKKHSSNLRQIVTSKQFEESGSILLLVSQSRDNIGFGAQFNPETRAGGRALTFYATAEIWFSVKEAIKKTVHGKPRKIGAVCQVKVKKNRGTGQEPTVNLHHYWSYGFDDLGSCVDWLVAEDHWGLQGGKADAKEFNIVGNREEVVKIIEEGGKQDALKMIVADVWQELQWECELKRKKKYE